MTRTLGGPSSGGAFCALRRGERETASGSRKQPVRSLVTRACIVLLGGTKCITRQPGYGDTGYGFALRGRRGRDEWAQGHALDSERRCFVGAGDESQI